MYSCLKNYNNIFEDAVTTLKDLKSKFSSGDLTNLMEASSTFKIEKNEKNRWRQTLSTKYAHIIYIYIKDNLIILKAHIKCANNSSAHIIWSNKRQA